jgi:hypothetical protein
MLGLVRRRRRGTELQLRLLSVLPLLRFGPATTAVGEGDVCISFPVLGGLLAKGAGGSLTLTASAGPVPELRTVVEDFRPRLGVLYEPLQQRIHVAVGRRWFARLAAGTP